MSAALRALKHTLRQPGVQDSDLPAFSPPGRSVRPRSCHCVLPQRVPGGEVRPGSSSRLVHAEISGRGAGHLGVSGSSPAPPPARSSSRPAATRIGCHFNGVTRSGPRRATGLRSRRDPPAVGRRCRVGSIRGACGDSARLWTPAGLVVRPSVGAQPLVVVGGVRGSLRLARLCLAPRPMPLALDERARVFHAADGRRHRALSGPPPRRYEVDATPRFVMAALEDPARVDRDLGPGAAPGVCRDRRDQSRRPW